MVDFFLVKRLVLCQLALPCSKASVILYLFLVWRVPWGLAQGFLFVTDSSNSLITCPAFFLLTFLSLDLHKLLEFVAL